MTDEPNDLKTDEPLDSEEMTPEQLAEAKRYHRADLACDLADRAIDLAFLAIVALLFARTIDGYLATLPGLANVWLRLGAMFLVVTAMHLAVSFPLSFYSSHVLEHQFGMSRQSLGAWLWRYVKRHSLTIAFGLVMIEGLYGVIWLTGPYWWAAAAGAFFLVSVVIGQLVPVLILPLFYKIERLEDDELAGRFARLTEGTTLSIEGVYRMQLSEETVKANAMLAGLGRTRRVILGDTLLDGFSPEEIDVVFTHEIGHHVYRHIYKLMLFGVVYSAAGFYVCDQFTAAWADTPSVQYNDVFTLPMLMLVITVFSMVLEPLQNGISRHFERQADRYSLDRTKCPAAFRSAFSRLAKINKADPNPPSLEVFLFHSHPPIGQRLSIAEENAEENAED